MKWQTKTSITAEIRVVKITTRWRFDRGLPRRVREVEFLAPSKAGGVQEITMSPGDVLDLELNVEAGKS
jgi:hypothetical protein